MRYSSISISGPSASGKTTLNDMLTAELGWESYSFGGYLRQRHVEEETDISFEDWYKQQSVDDLGELNEELARRVSQGNIVVDTRFAHIFGLETLKVYIDAPLIVRASRAFHKYPNKSHDERINILRTRELDELKFGSDIWKIGSDYRDTLKYNIVLNSWTLTQREEKAAIMALMRG